jgi:steroid delta-isomerase-like uncharacterized protein
MSEENKAVARRIIEEVWNKKNLDAIDELIAADCVNHTLPPGLPSGRKGVKAFIGIYLNAFPDVKFTIEDMIAKGDKVAIRWSATGTHTGELMGIPATGKQITVTGLDIGRYSGGKGVEFWGEFDQMGMMQQLGVIPTPEEA